ncbi:3-phenylpropionate/trans-cinnamate dioxygenase ferredoxin reductase subunit [Williamsia limnetica]|uniref:3-phenylpropionate/trans-cinnamate dioxygenase ferredoxin reductase subunit n=1 Tax=Williamsia limnetica TaxID=882452 RepID=A0A318RUZ5_WILLI|nr:FAD-dependent oxidoreductase [Williamsia limnetica]PYE13278.1 3-phenylpropionate/trans-cinnamate dioxygenase ferredoxin reductase subunit [Williamsia limnetica]
MSGEGVPPPLAASVAIVGASLAGLSTARELRTLGHTGPVTLIGAENHYAYDRPPLSKSILQQTESTESLMLADSDDQSAFTWRLGARAAGLRHTDTGHEVELADGGTVEAHAVIAATGARARTLIGADLAGVHTLRTLDDAAALAESLRHGTNVVVIGAGFIGCEVASSSVALGKNVTIVEASTTPGAAILGPELAARLHRRHAAHGVRLLTGAAIDTINGSERVESVTLADGSELPADVVVIGIGAVPNTEWLTASGVALDAGILTDADCATAVAGVYAVGDCARVHDPKTGLHLRQEHWSGALDHSRRAARRLLGLPAPKTVAPYFWSDQYGARLQVSGAVPTGTAPVYLDGGPDTDSFVATFGADPEPSAVVALDGGRLFTRLRKELDRSEDRRRAAQMVEHQ